MIQIQDDRGLHQVAIHQITIVQHRTRMEGIRRFDRHEGSLRRVHMRLAYGDVPRMRGRMMRVNRVHDILHEGAAITAMTIPVIHKEVATPESARQVVCIEACESMPEGVDALKKQPPVPPLLMIGLAQTIDPTGVVDQQWVEHLVKICLDDSMITPGLKCLRASPERLAHIGVGLKTGNSDGMRVDMPVALHVFVQGPDNR